MLIFKLFATAFSIVFYGIIASVVMMALLYFVLRSININTVKTSVFYFTGVVFFVILVIQFSLLIGAVNARSTVDDAEHTIKQIAETADFPTESQQALETIKEKYPILDVYVEGYGKSKNDITSLATVMGNDIHDYITSYIWHRAWWILGTTVLACGLVLLTSRNVSKSVNYSYDDSFDTSIDDTNEWGI